MLRRAVAKIPSESIIKPRLTRQLGLHKWTAAEEHVRTYFSSRPGRYVVSRAAGCVFCVDIDEDQKTNHIVLPENTEGNAVDLTAV